MSITFQNSGTVLAIIGVVVILVGCIGGGIRIKEIEIPKFNRTPRVAIILLGVIIFIIGICINWVAISSQLSSTSVQTPASSSQLPTGLSVTPVRQKN